ncbi:fungal-specific transcription factor domain-containing protein [Xylariaceae sp. FL0804]|nr:fungal-specific transcription factor domain-containing protein [Xylariaceae sp. FL0804]
MERHRKNHCWECRRRCLVCDSTEPACQRCVAAGVDCPGYGETEPKRYKWLTPGVVKSRGRRRKEPSSKENQTHQSRSMTTTTAKLASVTRKPGLATIPTFNLRTDEVSALAQAAEYFNSCIYQDLHPLLELEQNPHVYRLTAWHLQASITVPNYLRFGMLCMVLSHRMNRLGDNCQSRVLGERLYEYWGLAIRSLNEHLDGEQQRTGDMVIAGILTLLLADVHHGSSSNWRCHIDAIQRIIALRGGLCAVAESRALRPLLLCRWFLAVFGNTTCPASDLSNTDSHLDELGFLLERYGPAVSAFQFCPLPLFIEIVRINHLRDRAKRYSRESLQDADDILLRVQSFSPENWAQSKPSSQREWLLISSVYQNAVALYAILSLQSLSVLPHTPALRECCAGNGQVLQTLLQEGLPPTISRWFILWPLVLLGVQAAQSGAAIREFVAKQLVQLSSDAGTYAPLSAKRVLESFWASGDTSWDACFDRSYTFTTQIAVDVSPLLALE